MNVSEFLQPAEHTEIILGFRICPGNGIIVPSFQLRSEAELSSINRATTPPAPDHPW